MQEAISLMQDVGSNRRKQSVQCTTLLHVAHGLVPRPILRIEGLGMGLVAPLYYLLHGGQVDHVCSAHHSNATLLLMCLVGSLHDREMSYADQV